MFLDDELEQIYQDEGFSAETSKKMLKACLSRIPKPDTCSTQDFFNSLRRIEGGWRLFCKKHEEYDPEGFKNFMCNKMPDLFNDRIKAVLHWN